MVCESDCGLEQQQNFKRLLCRNTLLEMRCRGKDGYIICTYAFSFKARAFARKPDMVRSYSYKCEKDSGGNERSEKGNSIGV